MSTTQIHRIWIKASADKIWTAITDPEWNARYGYAAPQFYELKKGGRYHSTASQEMKEYATAHNFDVPDLIGEGEILEAEPPRRLVQTWRILMDPALAAEPFTTLTYEIEDSGPGVCRVTVTHELTGTPAHATMVQGTAEAGGDGGGGWAWVLSDLKSLLETGKVLAEA